MFQHLEYRDRLATCGIEIMRLCYPDEPIDKTIAILAQEDDELGARPETVGETSPKATSECSQSTSTTEEASPSLSQQSGPHAENLNPSEPADKETQSPQSGPQADNPGKPQKNGSHDEISSQTQATGSQDKNASQITK